MAIKLTDYQMKIVKNLVKYGEAVSHQILHIMRNHGLDQVEGCKFLIEVDPKHDFVTQIVEFGNSIGSDSGKISMVRGKRDAKFTPCGTNSAEYELLFADENLRSRMEKILKREKELPPDGLWIGDHANTDPVGNWEWDVNDSLS